jgi:hypothetical protein
VAGRVHAAVEAAASAVGGAVEGHLPPRHHHTTPLTQSGGGGGGGVRGGGEGGAAAAAGVLVVGPAAATSAAVAAVDGVWGVALMPPGLKLAPDLARWGGGGGGTTEGEGDEKEGCGGGDDDDDGDNANDDGGGGGNNTWRRTEGAGAGAMVQATLVSSARRGGSGGGGDNSGDIGGGGIGGGWSAVAARVAAAATAAGSDRRRRNASGGWTATSTDAGNVVAAAPCRAAAAAAARWLARRPEVLWVQPHAPRGTFANKYARAVVAGGAVAKPPSIPTAVDPPLWGAEITGAGEVVGIGDSGVDMRSCFFDDPNVPTAGPTHRKVVLYRATAAGDLSDGHGHGTHCAGTLAGSLLDSSTSTAVAPAVGLAPAAKLAVTDLGTGFGTEMIIPTSMRAYYAPAWSAGARVHSDSWGEVTSGYTVGMGLYKLHSF